MLEKHLLSPLSRDICFVTSWQWRQLLWKTHNGIVNTDTAHPLIIMCFHQKDCHFQQDNTNRQAEEGEKHIKRTPSNFNQPRRPWGWLRKWQKETLHCRRGTSICSHHDTTRERLRRLYSRVVWWIWFVPIECHLCKCVRAGEHVQAGTAFPAALNIHVLQNDLGAWPVYSHCTKATTGQAPHKRNTRSVSTLHRLSEEGEPLSNNVIR